MDSVQIDQISIVNYLKSLGYKEKYINGTNYWYCSPLRDEIKPSFEVYDKVNIWCDHGIGINGKIIELVCLLLKTDISGAMKAIESFSAVEKEKEIQLISIKSKGHIQNQSLLDYLNERRISISAACLCLFEIYCKKSGNEFTALGFKNDAGGYEISNKYINGLIGKKAITTIKEDEAYDEYLKDKYYGVPERYFKSPGNVHLFENIFDFLSAADHQITPSLEGDIIVLNSRSLLNNSLNSLREYRLVHVYLGNDEAGKRAVIKLQNTLGHDDVIDCSYIYKEYNNYNDYVKTL